MTGIKPSDHGIVVEHKETGIRYAVSDRNYNEKIHRKVRNLLPGETVLGYRPKTRQRSQDASDPLQDPNPPAGGEKGLEEDYKDVQEDYKTEGSAPAASQEKEGK